MAVGRVFVSASFYSFYGVPAVTASIVFIKLPTLQALLVLHRDSAYSQEILHSRQAVVLDLPRLLESAILDFNSSK